MDVVPPTYGRVYRMRCSTAEYWTSSAHLWAGISDDGKNGDGSNPFRPLMGGYKIVFWFSCCTQKYIKQIPLSSMDGETAARLAVIVWRKHSDLALHSDFVVV